MSRYIATLTRPITINVAFESTDVMTGQKIEEYSVPMELSAGPRRFKTCKAAKAWVFNINKEHSEAAVYNGKQ